MTFRWLRFSGNLVDLIGKIVTEAPRLTHAICFLKSLDGGDRFRSKPARELLRCEVAHRGKQILHIDDPVALSLPRYQNTQWCKRPVGDRFGFARSAEGIIPMRNRIRRRFRPNT